MSDNPILAKLHLKGGRRAVVLEAPESYRPALAALPPDAQVGGDLEGKYDFIHCFATSKADLERRAPDLKAAMKPGALLWVSYPKGKAIPTDLNRDILRELLGRFGLQAVALVAIDEVWSAMRFKFG